MIRFAIQSDFTASTRPQVLAGRFSRRGGFSLIEVAIALAIFVFGALAIVRIFPGALGVVQNSEQRAIGQRMAQTTLARLNAEPRSIPFALFDTNSLLTNPEQLQWSDFPGAVYGTPNSDDNQSLAQAAPEADDLNLADSALNRSAMGHFRRVSSEMHRVGANGEILLNFPYVGVPDTTGYNAALNPVIKVRRDVEGVTVDNAGSLNFTNARLNDTVFNEGGTKQDRPPLMHATYTVADSAAPVNRKDVTFYVSYNWMAGGYTNGVQDEPKRFPDVSSTTWTAAPVPAPKVVQGAAGNTVVPGSVKIWFYQSYKIPEIQQRNLAYDPNLGRTVQLNSLVVGFPLPTTTIQVGQLVSVDYTVPDWRFIVTDNNVTTPISDADTKYLTDDAQVSLTGAKVNQLVLPTRYVTDEALSNDPTRTNRPSQLYTLLRGSDPTGVAAVPARNDWSPDKTPTAPNISGDTTAYHAIAVRPKTGQVFFDVNNLVSPMARVVYRNIDGWVQQPAIAANFYLPYIDGADPNLFPREPWREYFYKANTTMQEEKPIFFHASEAGKSVTVSYVYQVGTDAPVTMRDVPIPIEASVEDVSNHPTIAFGDFNGSYLLNGTPTKCTKVSLAYLRDNQGRSIGADTGNGAANGAAKIIAISEIRGASIRVRSGWFDGSRYTQTAVVGYRPLDVESYNRS